MNSSPVTHQGVSTFSPEHVWQELGHKAWDATFPSTDWHLISSPLRGHGSLRADSLATSVALTHHLGSTDAGRHRRERLSNVLTGRLFSSETRRSNRVVSRGCAPVHCHLVKTFEIAL